MTSEGEIAIIERNLKVELPWAYKRFLIDRGRDIAFGLPILGLPAQYELSSVLGATTLLRTFRPELLDYLVIRIVDDSALCLDLTNVTKQDPPLVEISLSDEEKPKFLGRSFQSYIDESDISKDEVKYGLNRLREIIDRNNDNGRSYNHTDKIVPFKAKHWRTYRCCVHDKVVGLAAFRYSESINGIEIDTFLSSEHPNYEEGHGTKALISLILSDAYKNGTSMEIRFRQNRIPRSLLQLAKNSGINFQYSNQGIITHTESITIFSSVLGIQKDTRSKIEELEKKNELTLQGVCFLINSRVWTVEETNWLIHNTPRVKGLLFGRDVPENRLAYLESLSFGRSALAISRFKEKLQLSSDDELNELELNIVGELCLFRSAKSVVIDWIPGGAVLHLDAMESVTVLSRPRKNWVDTKRQFQDDLKLIKSKSGKKIIIYSNDLEIDEHFRNANYTEIRKYLEIDDILADVHILILPYSTSELDAEIIQKLKKSRRFRS